MKTEKTAELRLVNVSFTYQFIPPESDTHVQWAVHAGMVKGRLSLTVAIHGQDGGEGLNADTITAIADSIQHARGRLSGTSLHEQTS